MSVKLTVALPLYKAEKIAWLALESLCNQEQVNFDWELIICEEAGTDHAAFGEMAIATYNEKLKAAGCVRIKYIALEKWTPLPQKWALISKAASSTSNAFVLQAGDCYSEPLRVRRTADLIEEGADWVHSVKGVFLNLAANKRALYNHPAEYPTALNMAIRLDLVRNLPKSTKRKGIDRWLFNEATTCKGEKLRVVANNSPKWNKGIDTHGYNNISGKRGDKIALLRPPFYRCTGKSLLIKNMLPGNVVTRLKLLEKR